MTRGISSKKRGATSLSQAASVSHRGYRSVSKDTNHLRKDGVFLSQMIASCTEISPLFVTFPPQSNEKHDNINIVGNYY